MSRPSLPSRPGLPARPGAGGPGGAPAGAPPNRPPMPSRPGQGARPPPQPTRPPGAPAQPARPPAQPARPAPPSQPARPVPAELPRNQSIVPEQIPDVRPKQEEPPKPNVKDIFIPPTVTRVADDGWSERFTMDGAPYYFNIKSEAVSWNCPDSLKDPDDSDSESGNWRWCPDPEEAWVPGREVEPGVYITNTGNRVTMTAKDPNWPIMMSSLRHLEQDLVMIDDMNEGLIVHNLRERFKEDNIYTAVGTILISVNPFKRLPLYMPSIMEIYYKSGGNKRLPPHPFQIADNSYKQMREFKKHQSILISGESGAGKTEATKQCLAFFAEVAGSDSGVEQKIIEANPILEAFGNAKTGRNNNSSRFGKFMEIHFDKLGHIIGARTENYLLEKSRVVYQTEGERNYHIFYMLCVGSWQAQLGLNPNMDEHRYLNQSGCTEVEGMDDSQEFSDVLDAMNTLGFTPEEQKWIFETASAVLRLGDIKFKFTAKQDASVVENPALVDRISKLLNADPKEFMESIISRWFVIRGQAPTKIPFKPDEAHAAADACAKALYGRLFDWIVQRVNQAMIVPKGTENFIGVLDIFGFEIFEVNSFEQLCINFANEKLQQHFNEYTFKLEETVYQSEQIKFVHIEFIDNQPILDMIEKKPKGLLCQLDEEIVMPKGTDETWFNKITRDFEKTKYFQKVVKKKGHFVVNHYAGSVSYDSLGFLEKNRDSLWPDIYACLTKSADKKTSGLFPEDTGEKKGRGNTLGGQFRGQLTNLMDKLRSTIPSYIRCVKPNSVKRPNIFDSVMSLQQLTYAGVFEAIKIRQQGYPFRLTHVEFMRRYKCLSLKDGGWIPLKSRDAKGQIKEVLACTKQDFSDVQIGRSMALYRAPQQRIMELLRNLSLERICLVLQKWIRGCFARRFRAKLLKSRPVLRKALQTQISLEEATSAIEFTEGTVGTYSRLFPFKTKDWLDCQELKRQLLERKRVTDLCVAALPHDPETNFANLERAVQAGVAILEYPGNPQQMKAFQDAKDLYDLTCNRRQCRAELKRATGAAERQCLEEQIELAAQLGIPNAPEIAPAKAMIERCKKEEALCAELESAQATGGMLQWATGQGGIDAQTPQTMFQKASSFGMKTARGLYLQTLCQYLHQLRTAIKSSPWDGFDDWVAVRGVLSNQPGAQQPAEPSEEGEEAASPVSEVASHPEVAWANDEVELRTRQREIHEQLRAGMNSLNEETMLNFIAHIEANPFVGGADQQSRMKKIEEDLFASAKSALDRVIACRTGLESAIESKEEGGLRSAIDTAVGLPVDNTHAVALLEPLVQAKLLVGLKFHVDYGRRVEVGLILDDELAESTVAEIVALSSGATIQVSKAEIIKELNTQSDYLEAALKHGSEIEIVTPQGQRFVEQGQSLLALRRCLLTRDWGSLDSKLGAALSAQAEGPETNLAKDETAGRCTAADCLEGLRVAVEEVKNPSDDYGHPSEGTLDSRLAQAERLEMKDLPEIVAGREMLERIRSTRKELQVGLTITQYDDAINLAEEFTQLYTLFEASTKQLNTAIAMSKDFSYETKETKEAEGLLQEVTILWYLQEDLQSGGYYDGATPQAPSQETVVVEPISSHYNDYSGFPYVTKIGKYIVQKVYFILTLRGGLQTFCDNPDNINVIVPAAAEIGCPTTPELVSIQAFMEQLNATRAAMAEAENVVREDLLINAIKMCDALFFNNADVERVRALKDLVIALNEECRKALWILDKDRMNKVLGEAKAIRLTTLHFEYLQVLVDMGPMDWLKYEIKKAKELDQENRKIRLAIGMKDLTLDQFGHLFGLSSLKNMRSPENYASQKLLTLDRKKLAAGMLSFSKSPAHTSLIDFAQLVHDTDPQAHKLVQQLIKESTKTFKNIMGYMLDKKYPYPTVLVQETIQLCLDQPMLRSEVYLQTIKQITNHPIPANAKKGYELLAIWCWQFPPQPDLDNILETYLRGVPEKSIAYLGRLRDVQYGGCGRTAPSPDQIEAFVREFFSTAPKKSTYEENVEVIPDCPYTDEFFSFETPKTLFQFDDEDARLKVV